MANKYTQLAFTDTVRRVQDTLGSREIYARTEAGALEHHRLGDLERAFIEARDSFYLASVGETGWPYLQHRGGPAGFLKVLDPSTLGFADYAGNRQYITTGNVLGNDRVSLFLMDYPNRRRLKLLGRMELVSGSGDHGLDRLHDGDYRARVERYMIIHVEAFDWNCPKHITRRYTQAEVEQLLEPLREEIRVLKMRAEGAASS